MATLTWSDLKLHVQVRKPNGAITPLTWAKETFKSVESVEYGVLSGDVTGYVKPGSMTLVLGGPGSGKTTLLHLLAGRLQPTAPDAADTLLLDAHPFDDAHHRRVGLVIADDVHYPTLSVKETLFMAARMTLGLTHDECAPHVERVTKMLKIEHCLDTIVGDETLRGISGGEKRRVSLAVELLKNPEILCLDGPTSGLDSSVALDLVRQLKAMTQTQRADGSPGQAVICALLQPSMDIFKLFDNVIILNEGMQTFFGPADAAVAHFESLGLQCPPRMTNAAEFLVQVCERPRKFLVKGKSGDAAPGDADAFRSAFSDSAAAVEMKKTLLETNASFSKEKVAASDAPVFALSTTEQFSLLLKRALTNNARNPGVLPARMGSGITMGILFGTLLFNVGRGDVDSADFRNLFGLLVSATAMMNWSGVKLTPICR
jgi:ABC-type multidrug transport system ATPase subunit